MKNEIIADIKGNKKTYLGSAVALAASIGVLAMMPADEANAASLIIMQNAYHAPAKTVNRSETEGVTTMHEVTTNNPVEVRTHKTLKEIAHDSLHGDFHHFNYEMVDNFTTETFSVTLPVTTEYSDVYGQNRVYGKTIAIEHQGFIAGVEFVNSGDRIAFLGYGVEHNITDSLSVGGVLTIGNRDRKSVGKKFGDASFGGQLYVKGDLVKLGDSDISWVLATLPGESYSAGLTVGL